MTAHTAIPQLFYNGVWNLLIPASDPTSYALTEEKIKITRGFPAEGADPRASKVELTLYDEADKYRPTNPASPIYGQAGTNTTLAVTCDGSTRVFAQCSSFKPDQTPGFTLGPPVRGKRWVDIEAEGTLRRIGLWTQPLRSPIYRTVSRLGTLLGYWPLEDASKAQQISNTVANGQPGQAAGVTFQGAEGANGSDKTAQLSLASASALSGKFQSASSTAGWQMCFSVDLGTVTATTLPMISWTTSNGYTWSLSVDSTTYTLKVVDRAGTVLKNTSSLFGTGAEPGQWMRFRIMATVSAGTVTVEWAWYPQSNAVLYGITDTFAGTVGALVSWRVTANANNDTAGYAHVFAVTGTTDDLLGGDLISSFNGYVGETAAARFRRLCLEEGISRTVIGTVSATWRMGRQTPSTFLELLKEIAKTEDALIFDTRDSIGLTMRTRASRYNQTAKMALTYPGDIAPPLVEVISDVDAHNLVTASQRDGGDATATEASGPMSVLAPPNGIGEYKQTVDVNVESETDLPLLAGWWLNKGTVPGARYEQVVIDLDQNPGLTTAANSVDLGDRITITGRTPDMIDLLVIGIYEEIETHRRKITFTCVPALTWVTGVYGGATGRRYGITAATINGTMTTTSTTLTANLTTDWFGTQFPYDVMVAGERMTVTAAGAHTTTQALTVTRSVNGVVKTHAANEPIQIHDDHVARYGL